MEKCDIEEQDIAYMYSKEVHNKFIVVDKNSKDLGIIEPYGIKADGIITSDPNIALMLIVGDCITTLFYDPISHAIGIAHCGTKWIDNGTAEKTISLMEKQFQTNPKNLIVGIGPSIFIGSFEYEFWTPSNPNYWEGCV